MAAKFTVPPNFHLKMFSARLFKSAMLSGLTMLALTTSTFLPREFGQSVVVLAQEKEKESVILNDEALFTKYVRAAFEIERQRRSMMGQVKELTGGTLPNNVCGNVKNLPAGQQPLIQGICLSFAKFASATVTKKYKLSPQQFNVFQRQVNKPNMRKRINRKIRELKLK